MTLKVLLSATPQTAKRFAGPIADALATIGLLVDLRTDHPPETVDYIVYGPNDALSDFSPFTRTKAVLSLWAGVETIVENPTLTQPLTRMVDSGLREGMVEWVCGHVLRYHLGTDAHVINPDHNWSKSVPPLARNRQVCVLGLGELGSACAEALAYLNFRVSGWSRRPKELPAIRCYSGDQGLDKAIKAADILVLLLPHTSETENLLDETRLALLPKGAFIINPGRGALINDNALLESLDSGHVAHATLDVFRIEPLPRQHPFWSHAKVTVTPHIASDTRAETAAAAIADNILRSETGRPLRFLVDRSSGY